MQKWTSSGLYTTAIKVFQVFMNEHHQVGETEGTLKILARLKDQASAEEKDRVPLDAQSSSNC